MNDLQIFNNPDFGEIRTIEIDGEGWFVGNDIASALGYAKPRNAIATHVDAEDARIQGILTSGGMQQMKVINESGLYALIIMSELPSAKKFKRWVTSEVLPSIRKHGAYAVPQLSTNELVLKIAQANVELEKQLGEVKAEVQQIGDKLETALQVFSKPGSNWKDSMELAIREMSDGNGWALIKLKGKLYQELEIIANADLQSRLTRKRNRMKKQGATRRDYMAVNKLDIISYDKQLLPIFEGIVRKYQAIRGIQG